MAKLHVTLDNNPEDTHNLPDHTNNPTYMYNPDNTSYPDHVLRTLITPTTLILHNPNLNKNSATCS